MRRVVITGMGAITPVGLSVEEFWNSVKEGRTNFAEVTRFDTTKYRAHMAAEINNFNPKDYMDFKSAKRMELFSQYAVAAAKEAIEQSGLDMTKEDPFRVGCSVGSGIGSMQVVEKSCEILNTKGPGRLNPLMIPLLISNMASGNVSIQFGLRGKNINVVTACATGTHSIGEAYRTIQWSDADVMVAGGTEAAITPTGFGGFAALTALTSSTDPKRCSIPFDKERSGFVMGEGAGVVVLEELEHAKARGAKILAEVVGYGATGDAFHITSPAEDGSGAAKAMELAVKEAGVDATVQTELLSEVSEKLTAMKKATAELADITDKAANAGDAQAVATAYKDDVMTAMATLRKPADELEVIMPKEEWPMPTYGDLVFEL